MQKCLEFFNEDEGECDYKEDDQEQDSVDLFSDSDTFCNDSLRQYLREIGKYPLLNQEEEIALGKRIELGDMMAKQELVDSNLRLVVSIAKHYSGKDEYGLTRRFICCIFWFSLYDYEIKDNLGASHFSQ